MENLLLLSFDNQEIANFLQPIDWMFLVFLFLIFALFQLVVLNTISHIHFYRFLHCYRYFYHIV